jgi:hypothetical protein
MTQRDHSGRLPIPLYHGTSSLFLEGIFRTGLGGTNPILEWKILEFAQLIYPLTEQHLLSRPDLASRVQSFGWMVQQKSTGMNFQHGDTYLSPARSTAVRYAVNKRYGSELLTYTLDLLGELIRLNIDAVTGRLYREYQQIFDLLDISPAPLLIRADNVFSTALKSEYGGDVEATIEQIRTTIQQSPRDWETMLQQCNFRLAEPIPAGELEIWMLAVSRWDRFTPEYSLYKLSYQTET